MDLKFIVDTENGFTELKCRIIMADLAFPNQSFIIKLVILCSFAYAVPDMISDIFSAFGQEQEDALSTVALTNESIKGGGGESEEELDLEPKIRDENIKAELVYEASMNPTSMVFLDENDILLLELVNGHCI